jgi:hypothetical protein
MASAKAFPMGAEDGSGEGAAASASVIYVRLRQSSQALILSFSRGAGEGTRLLHLDARPLARGGGERQGEGLRDPRPSSGALAAAGRIEARGNPLHIRYSELRLAGSREDD